MSTPKERAFLVYLAGLPQFCAVPHDDGWQICYDRQPLFVVPSAEIERGVTFHHTPYRSSDICEMQEQFQAETDLASVCRYMNEQFAKVKKEKIRA